MSPLEELGTTGETVYKADLMMNYTFTEFEALDPITSTPLKSQNQVNTLQNSPFENAQMQEDIMLSENKYSFKLSVRD